ncbi:hypothetical protein [Niallia taxi]|uniref:hypothetical protein n=1 Tax=Niallia taxi TaxID=2499688 RepID=UPI0025519605|nr:hypothetical protein [Niallia taxi]MDK8641344.1 hypothetical protein [Niallia taxi]
MEFVEERCEGIACKVRGSDKLLPFKPWDKPENIQWYCEEHYKQAKSYDEQQKRAFLDYYSDPLRREWLPEKSLKLYKRYTKK